MKIEKGVPVPALPSGRLRRYETKAGGEYPFLQMEIGDSFVVPIDRRVAVGVSCVWYKKKRGMKFTTRKTEDGKFVRVWRIS